METTSTVPTSTIPKSTIPTSTIPTSTVPTSTDPTSTDSTSTDPTVHMASIIEASNVEVPIVEAPIVDVDMVSNVDVDMASNIDLASDMVSNVDLGSNVDATTVPLMGSSRTSGGLFRGRALGNVPNHADLGSTSLDLDIPVKGEVSLYITDQYPRDVKFDILKGEAELVVMVKVVGRMASILQKVARKFSIIQSSDYHIYYRRATKWIALGRFDYAVQDDDDCEWVMSSENIPELHLLIVSQNLILYYVI